MLQKNFCSPYNTDASILFLHCILKLYYYQMRQPLPSLIFCANQVRGAIMPRDPVVVVTAPENITNILPTAQLLTEQHVESERERMSRVELTIQICASLDAGKTERQAAQKYHLDRNTVRKIYKKKQKWDRLVRLGCGSMNQYHPPRQNAAVYSMRPEPTCCKKKYPPGKTLLVLDMYVSHRTEVALSLLRRQEIDVFVSSVQAAQRWFS